MKATKLLIAGVSILVLIIAWWLVLSLIKLLFVAIIVGLIASGAVVMIAFAIHEYYAEQDKQYRAMKALHEQRRQEFADHFNATQQHIDAVRQRINRERI